MKNKIIIKFITLGIVSIFLFFSFSSNTQVYISRTNQFLIDPNVKRADYWDLTASPILINGSDPTKDWAYTKANYDWCSGSGTWDDPYVIENITIDGQNAGSCIEISYSDVYFIIRNCTLFNSGSLSDDAGIFLFRTNNAQILNNTCNLNSNYGIYLDDCKNNSISENILKKNNLRGIRLFSSINNTILRNVVSLNSRGIELWNSDDNAVLENFVCYNSERGIYFYDCSDSIISGNIASVNEFGIHIMNSNNNKIWRNTVKDNTEEGILVAGNHVSISQNLINNSKIGLDLHPAQHSTISNNKISHCDNGIHLNIDYYDNLSDNSIFNNTIGVYIEEGVGNTVFYNNYFKGNAIHAIDNSTNVNWNNSIIGNYWDNYSGIDANNDGIGEVPYNISGTAGSKDYYPIVGDPLIIPNTIHIDDSGVSSYKWIWAATRAWCKGQGTSSDPYIIENLIIDAGNNGDGILIGNSSTYFKIINCTVFNFSNQPHSGINLYNTKNGELINNNCTSVWMGNGFYLRDCNSTIIIQNYANLNVRGAYLKNCVDNIISGNIFDENGDGITLESCDYNNITGNSLIDNTMGIHVHYGDHNEISYNLINDNDQYGILLDSGSYNHIKENQIENNDYGIRSYMGTIGTIADNNIIDNHYAIHIEEGENINIVRNFIDQNDYGLLLEPVSWGGSRNNIISENWILNCYYWGISISFEGNSIYLNNFTGNPIHAIDDGSNNQWDNGAIGNYWDDYIGEDKNDDGIGDTAYNITGSANSKDYYPIWEDGDDLPPIIIINSPHLDQLIGRTAPNFSVRIIEPNLDNMWYTIDHGLTNVSFTTNSTINQALWETQWDMIAINDSITIGFFANDTLGHLGYNDVEVIKTDVVPPDNGGDGTLEDIPGYDIILIIGVLTMTSLITIKIGNKQKKYRT